jgi:2-hydroxycyclohexanecarboxyl-CoA dehydrogenase
MDLGLDGRVVIVTGGASNLGRAITLGFASEGARVVIADVDDKQAKKVEGEAPSGTITARHCDVTDSDSVTSMVEFVETSMGRVDCLVNCAGWTIDRLFMEKPRAEWEREIAIDTWGFINSVRAVLDGMVKRRYGRIVSIGSDAGRMGEWREAVYSGTKASIIAMSKAIAREVGKHNITLNVVCPGLIVGSPATSGANSMWSSEQLDKFTPEVREKAAKAYPLRRLGKPEDVVPAVLMLASDRASYITGQTLSVSGGYTMI